MEAAPKIAAVEKYVEAFEAKSIDLIRDLFADDATVEDPVGTDVYDGIEAILGFYRNAFEMNARLELTGTPRCAGNAVAFPFRVDAAGMKLESIDVFEFGADGKVVSMKAYWGSENVLS